MTGEIDPFESGDGRPNVVAVSLQPTGHLYTYLAGPFELRRGTKVLVEGEAGLCLATVEVEPQPAARALDLAKLKPVLGVAGERELQVEEENRQREAAARRSCLLKIRERGLDMKLVSVDFLHDRRKAIFYFTAESRMDFRDLVRDLANNLRIRIEMRQIGAREETKLTGGLGPCGRELCCSSWLRDFEAVTLKMAREQGLALNPSRLAGMCGRLKCCLRYEYATYVELKRGLPPIGKAVECVKGDGKVLRHNVLKRTVLIQRDEDGGVIEATLDDLVEQRAN